MAISSSYFCENIFYGVIPVAVHIVMIIPILISFYFKIIIL